MDKLTEELWLANDVTRKTGMLHDSHILNLKYWILILTNATKVELGFNSEKSKLIFNLLEFDGQPPKDQFKRFDVLLNWSRQLLGNNELSLEIKKMGKIIYPKVKNGRYSKSPGRKFNGNRKKGLRRVVKG